MKKFRLNFLVLLLAAISLLPVIWFWGKGDVLINGVDTNFPLNPAIWFQRRFYVWNNISNAGVDFSSSTAGIFFHLIQFVPYLLGFKLQLVQIISFVFWLGTISCSSFVLAKSLFPKIKPAQILFVILYLFNIYTFNSWENVKVANLALIAGIPLVVSVLIKLRRGEITRIKSVFYSSLIGIIVSGSGINPAYFLCFFLVIAIVFLSEIIVDFKRGSMVNLAKDYATAGLTIIFVNLFWILPTANFIFQNISPAESINTIGFTNWLDSLSENTSLFNVMRLQGAWDWYAFDDVSGLPLYIPYALNFFYNFWFIGYSVFLTSMVFASLVLGRYIKSRSKSIFLSFILMMIVGLFLGAGTHPPTGDLFRLLLNKLPFFSLFRSPWYIFTPLVVLSYAGLISFLFYTIFQKANKSGSGLFRAGVVGLFSVLLVGNLLYSYPIITGKIFRPRRHDGFFVTFPEYVFEAGEWLSTREGDRVIGYPDDEIEQFDWRYRGIESVLTLVADREVLFAPLNDPNSGIADLVRQFYLHLKKNQLHSAYLLAGKLNTGIIFEKADQQSLSKELPNEVKSLPVTSFGKWNFYDLPEDKLVPKIHSPADVYRTFPNEVTGSHIVSVPKNSILINSDDSVGNSIKYLENMTGDVVLASNLQSKDFENFRDTKSNLSNRLMRRDLSQAKFNFYIPQDGEYAVLLEDYQLDDFGLSLDQEIGLVVDDVYQTLKVLSTSDYIKLEDLYLTQGDHVIYISLENNNLVESLSFDEDEGFETEGEGKFEITEEDGKYYLSVLNKSQRDVAANIQLEEFDPLSIYLVEFRYKQVYGNKATVLGTQSTDKTLVKTQVERLPNHPEWNSFSFYYEPVKTNSRFTISLVAPQTNDPLGTKVLYDDVVIRKVFTNNLVLVNDPADSLATPSIEYEQKSPVEYEVSVGDVHGDHMIVFSENYSSQWIFETFDSDGNKLDIEISHLSANGYANAWFIEDASENYKVRIYYRPQRLFILGSAFSAMTLLAAGIALIKSRHE